MEIKNRINFVKLWILKHLVYKYNLNGTLKFKTKVIYCVMKKNKITLTNIINFNELKYRTVKLILLSK